MLLQLEIHDVVNLAKTQITQLTAERSSLTQQHESRTLECQQLQSELKAAAESRKEAVESVAAHHRYIPLSSELDCIANANMIAWIC